MFRAPPSFVYILLYKGAGTFPWERGYRWHEETPGGRTTCSMHGSPHPWIKARQAAPWLWEYSFLCPNLMSLFGLKQSQHRYQVLFKIHWSVKASAGTQLVWVPDPLGFQGFNACSQPLDCPTSSPLQTWSLTPSFKGVFSQRVETKQTKFQMLPSSCAYHGLLLWSLESYLIRLKPAELMSETCLPSVPCLGFLSVLHNS